MSGFGTKRKHQIGKLRHPVQVQRAKQTDTDGRGQPVYEWETIIEKLYCSIQTLFGDEQIRARQLCADASHRIECRFDDRVVEQHRILFGTREFYIGHVDNIDEVGRFMSIMVRENK